MTEHDHNFLSTKGPGVSERHPLAGLTSGVFSAREATDHGRAEAKDTEAIDNLTLRLSSLRLAYGTLAAILSPLLTLMMDLDTMIQNDEELVAKWTEVNQ